MIKQFKRAQQKKQLKKERENLLTEMGISKRTFKKKRPKVNKHGKDFDVVNPANFIKYGNSKGKKMSLIQDVLWLRDLKEATKELRELKDELEKEKSETIDKSEEDVKDEGSFKIV